MAANTAVVTSSVIGTTSQHKRDFSERIRRLYPGLTKMLALVKGSNLDAFGKVAYSGKGMIGKKEAKRMDPEWATYTPIDVTYLCTGGGATEADIADTTFFQEGDVIVNSTTGEVGIVVRLYSATALYVTAITGGTWSCSAGDYITCLASSFEEGTARYNTITNELTTNKTYLQIFREGVAIADTVKNTPQYTDEGMMERYRTDKMVQALRKIEGSFWFSKQGTSGTTSAALVAAGATETLYTMKGVLSYAGTAFDMQGAFNWETFNTTLYPIMPKTMQADETVYMACGRKVAATMNQWANNKYMIVSDNKELKFGQSPKTYIMGGALEVEVLVHDLFDTGAYTNSAVFFQNSDLVYRFMTGLDINIRENAQLPAMMGTVDIIEGAVGLQSNSGGDAIKYVTGLLAA
jgi:hypothetical protein